MFKPQPAGKPLLMLNKPKQAMALKAPTGPAAPRKARIDKGERRTLHPQSHDEFLSLGHTDKY